MADLIDTTEMYLKTIFEMKEDGVPPLRARIVERLDHSGPTVSQTIARMERDGLVNVMEDRVLALTDKGQRLATEVVRKHRLAERLLMDTIGLDWMYLHDEACRWEHVMSELVENRLMEILDHPSTDPYGNPIPGQGTINPKEQSLLNIAGEGEGPARVTRIGEPVQALPNMLKDLAAAGFGPGAEIQVLETQSPVVVQLGGHQLSFQPSLARHIFVVAE